MDSNIIKVQPSNTKTTKIIINTQKQHVSLNKVNFISTPPTSKIQMFKQTNKSHNMILIK